MIKFDEKNCKILNLLQEDCRISLTEIAKKVNLSVDSVKKRIVKLKREGIFYPKIQLRPRHFGFPYIVDIKIKLHNYNDKKIKDFVDYLNNHPRVAELLSISGEWDYTVVIIAKDHEDLGVIGDKIRNKFGDLINDWSESLTKVVYKFEKYDMLKLMGQKKDN